jgi:Mce-associated membrane protein
VEPGAESTSSSQSPRDRTPTGKSRPIATPVKSAPLGRKRKSGSPTKAEPAKAGSGKAESVEAAGGSAQITDATAIESDAESKAGGAELEDSAVSTHVSYRERRAAARGTARNSKKAAVGTKAPGRPTRVKGNMRGLGVALAALTAIGLIAAMVVASVIFVLGTNKIDDRNAECAEFAAFARQTITNLTTLNPQNIDGSIKSFQDSTSGKAMEQAGQSMQQTVNMIKSENVSTKGTVISEAVTACDASSATVIMVSSWEMNQPNVPDQQTVLQTFRWKLEFTVINGAKKLTNFEWVT